jgi:ATP diphosphatase
LRDEVGDLLFVLANLARKLDLDPEDCLRGANRKFERRFGHIEQSLRLAGKSPADSSLEEMDSLWAEAKRIERQES